MADALAPRDGAYFKSPEYKRLCRARKAAREGREFRPSGPGGKGRAAGYAKPKLLSSEQQARAAWRDWIEQRAPAWWLNRYHEVRRQVRAAAARAGFKARYYADPKADHARTRRYKDRHPDRVATWHRVRQERLMRHGVEPVTMAVMRKIRERVFCPYCVALLADTGVEIDHVIPLAAGGRHEARNLVACCPGCNRRKGGRTFSEWLGLLTDKARPRAERMFMRRFGRAAEAERVALAA